MGSRLPCVPSSVAWSGRGFCVGETNTRRLCVAVFV
jgi:hypothetical protein